ncbi:MAG: dihydrolipoyl dehydrogenase, partial [Deltaproteobacteria bacterium]|nr:dihydrolipoyl dehydrogenase [Deltaproteobacteria bacterium]
MGKNIYDLIVIGSGPGGYVGAIRGSQLGLKTLVIEKEKPGGVCLNVGCIPTKALIERAGIFNNLSELKSIGIKADKSELNYAKVQKKGKTASSRLSKGVKFLLDKNNIDYIPGCAVKISSGSVTTDDGTEFNGKNILIATGSSPKSIPGFGIDEESILTSTGMLNLTELPGSLIVLGSGAIGIEFAYIMNSFGVKVTVVEMVPRILPLEDLEIAEVIEKSLSKQGIKFIKGTGALSLKKTDDGVNVILNDEEKTLLHSDKVLVAIGRQPNTESVDLSGTEVNIDGRGFIETGDFYETAEKGVFAIGDIIPTAQLAHVASKEAEIAVEHMAGKETVTRLDDLSIPSAVYCEPQVASFGLTQSGAEEMNLDCKCSVFPFRGNGKATATGHSEGLVKIISDKEGFILGAHIA